jgi:Rps23 Pro-64 3,4-dihydroxylase Tpa1-like proline 4-hydroxylase
MNDMIDYKKINDNFDSITNNYNNGLPFKNVIIDNFLIEEFAFSLEKSFDNIDWLKYRHVNENKYGNNGLNLPPIILNLINELHSESFIGILEKVTGISDLIPDLNLESGGVHQSRKNGFLNIHTDFTTHPYNKKWKRRLNLLIYISHNWKDEYGGALEFWSSDVSTCIKKVDCKFNRCVIFNTTESSFHGLPTPIDCPEDVTRNSVALYYYTIDNNYKGKSTNYMPIPSDNFFKSKLILIDKFLLSIFHKLKGAFGLKDSFISKIMKFFK